MEPIPTVSFEDYLAAEDRSQIRHEFVGGRLYAQAGATERHDLATSLLLGALWDGAIGRGCRAFAHNRRLVTPIGDTYYPDVLVSCGTAAHSLYETSAVLVAEVLSPTAADIDRREKSGAYASVPGLELYLLVHPDVPRIEAARPRDGRISRWEVFGPGSVLTAPVGVVDVDRLYEQLASLATTP